MKAIQYSELTKKQKMEVLKTWPNKSEQTTHTYRINDAGGIEARYPSQPVKMVATCVVEIVPSAADAERWAQVKEIGWCNLVRSSMNPRKHFPDEVINKLALSIRKMGLISALLVRPLPDGRLEIVCGECRHRACDERPHPFIEGETLPRVERVKVDVRCLSDKEVLELMLTENIRRFDLTPLEESDAFSDALKAVDPSGRQLYTVESLAEQIGCSADYVRDRCALNRLNKEGRKALESGAISFSTARTVCRQPAGIVEPLLDVVLNPAKYSLWYADSGYLMKPLTEEQTLWVIHERFTRDLTKASFSIKDATLVPIHKDLTGARVDGGSCLDCPWNTSVAGGRKFSKEKLCLNPECYSHKIEVNVSSQMVKALEDGATVLSEAASERVLRDGSYVRLSEKPALDDLAKGMSEEESPKWETLISGDTLPPVVVAVDRAGNVHRLVERKLAIAAAQRNGNEGFLSLSGGRAASLQDGDAAEQQRKQREEAKLRNVISFEAMSELLKLVDASEPELFWDWLVDVAAGVGGNDAAFFACKRRGEPNGIEATAAVDDYANACATSGEKRALACELLIARAVRFRGVDAEHFEALAGIYGLDVPSIEKRVRSEAKAKGKKSEEGGAK